MNHKSVGHANYPYNLRTDGDGESYEKKLFAPPWGSANNMELKANINKFDSAI